MEKILNTGTIDFQQILGILQADETAQASASTIRGQAVSVQLLQKPSTKAKSNQPKKNKNQQDTRQPAAADAKDPVYATTAGSRGTKLMIQRARRRMSCAKLVLSVAVSTNAV